MKKILGFLFLTLFLQPFTARAQMNIVIPQMENYLLQNGILFEDCHHPQSYDNLIKLFETHLSYIDEDLKDDTDPATKDYGIHEHLAKIENEDKEKLRPFLQTGLDILLDNKDIPYPLEDKRHACFLASRLLYSFKALGHTMEPRTMHENIKVIKSITLPNKIRYPKHMKSFIKKPVGEKLAKKESHFLVNDGKNSLENMTPDEISKLDIREDDPQFYSDAYIANKDGNELANNFYQKIEKAITKWVRKKQDDKSLTYRISAAPKTLFLKKIKAIARGTGAHPKVKAFDPMRIDHKVKFGEERAAEAIVNHLHLAIGGKFADINVTHTYQNPVVLILHKKKDDSREVEQKLINHEYNDKDELEKLCKNVATVEIFRECFINSRYNFMHVDQYILESGIINEKNMDRLLHYESTPVKEFKKEKIIGREYIVIRESSTELKNRKVFITGSGIPLSTMGSLQDRGMRASGLFHMFVDNLDAKDLNFKGVMLNPKFFPELEGKNASHRYLEYPSDTGAALGRFWFTGSTKGKVVNENLPIKLMENKYITKYFLMKEPLRRKYLWYNNTNLYKPESWEKATLADNMWMARRIVDKLTNEVIVTAVLKANMPEMWNKALIARIIKRRDQIAHHYHLNKNYKVSEKYKPNLSVSLKTPNERALAAERFHLSLQKIHKLMIERKLLKSEDANCNYVDMVLKEGKVRDGKKSVINAILDENFPSGIGF